MWHNIFYLLQLIGTLYLVAGLTLVFGLLLCTITNKLTWIPIVIYLVIMWGAIIAACFVDIQLVLRAVL